MKKLTILVLASCLAAMSSRADVIYQDIFSYSNGPIADVSTNANASTNWFTHSGNDDTYVNNHRLEVSSSTTSGGVTFTRTGDVHRNLSVTNNSIYTNAQQVLYASFIVNFTNLPTVNGAYFAHFYYSSSGFSGRLWALVGNSAQTTNNFSALPNTFRLGVSATGSGGPSKIYAMDLALNTDYQVVLGLDPVSLDAVTLWINPISSSDPSAISSDTYAPGANIANAFAFRQASGFGGFLTVSNLVLATTFSEAATNVLATNAVAPKIVYQPTGVTNFVGSTVTLSAVATGQGLGNLTYQWLKSGASYSNPAGNTNVLTIANAQTTDNGNYALVVTTPYGLSVTSSVSTVLISAAPVPPSFITQPVSQTAYKGQTVILSTTVSSPGNVSYQWYSNNVSIAGANSSTYELDNVATNFSASYKVAVTNDVAVNGVVSTNAVLTVLNPPVVSIAYLRTLVDSSTFQPTNSTIPYQITGVVTTFTNTTSGNTSSYFLQDGTAGINIFATFGSTFRPAQGDVVTFIGVLSYFSTTGLELFADPVSTDPGTSYPSTSYTDTGTTNALPTPITIPFTATNTYGFAYVNTNLAGSLVTITNVYFGSSAGTTISTNANVAVTVTNASGKAFVLEFFDFDQDTAGKTLPSFAYSVTGVLFGGSPNFSVGMSRFADIVTTVPLTPIPLNLNYSGGNVTFTWTNATFALQSSTNVVGPYVTITNAASGFIINATTSAPTMFFRLYHP